MRPSDIGPGAPCKSCNLQRWPCNRPWPCPTLPSSLCFSWLPVFWLCAWSQHSMLSPSLYSLPYTEFYPSGYSLGDCVDSGTSKFAVQTVWLWQTLLPCCLSKGCLKTTSVRVTLGGRFVKYLSWLSQDLWGVGPSVCVLADFLCNISVTSVL